MNVYLLVDYSFEHPEDIAMSSAFSTPEEAINYALKMVNQMSGKDIYTHGIKVDGVSHKETRISNHRSLGSDIGVTYKSAHTGNRMAMIVIERNLRSPLPETQPIESDFLPDSHYAE